MKTNSSIAEEAIRVWGNECKIIKNVKMLYEDELAGFLNKMEEAHRKTSKSKLVFKEQYV